MSSPDPNPQASLQMASNALLELMDHLEDVQCWIKDPEGRFVWVNQTLHRWCAAEINREGLLGKTDYDIFPKDIADRFRADDDRVLAGKPVIDRVEPVVGPDHLTSWNVTTKLPIRSEGGTVVGTVGITRPKEEHSPSRISSGMLRVMSHIRENFIEPLHKEHLASLLQAPVDQVDAIFEKELKMSPQHYLRRVRVRLACRDLTDSKISFEEIAARYGFFDQGDFFAQFLAEVGENPRVYRTHLQQIGALH
jgi:AraC-like DNA-binding protein